MEENKHLNFLCSLFLIIFSIYVIISGYNIYKEAGETMSLSPGLLPLILGGALLFCSLLQLITENKESGLKKRLTEVKLWFNAVIKEENTKNMVMGTFFIGIYSFVLLGKLKFWLASLIFTISLMIFLKAASYIKIVILSIIAVGSIVLLFQILFRIPLP